MSQMLPYPNKKSTPNRKVRKSDRNKVFITNRRATKLRKEAKKEAQSAL